MPRRRLGNRRRALNFGALVLLFVFVAVPLASFAQSAAKVHRIGFLSSLAASDGQFQIEALRQGLRDLGYVEGRNLVLELRWAEGDYQRLPRMAKELVDLDPDLIVSAGGPPPARALKVATKKIPVVFISGSVMAAGIVSSLSRPGENLTGLEVFAEELDAKRLELLHEILPKAVQVAAVWNPGNLESGLQRKRLQDAARVRGMRMRFVQAQHPSEIDAAFASIMREQTDAVVVSADPMLVNERRRIVELAGLTRVPAIYFDRTFAEAGGLLSYGTDLFALYRSAGTYVDKILKGAKPADLPVQQPTQFELVINLKTAKTLGLIIPPPILLRADRVIE
jgi:putative tryptophan/tyrosine transport system substrate-binding protein